MLGEANRVFPHRSENVSVLAVEIVTQGLVSQRLQFDLLNLKAVSRSDWPAGSLPRREPRSERLTLLSHICSHSVKSQNFGCSSGSEV